MKPKIFTRKFWKDLFHIKESPLEVANKTPELEREIRESHPNDQSPEFKLVRPEKLWVDEAAEIPWQEPAKEVGKERVANVRTKKRVAFSLVRSELNLEQNSIFTVSTYRKKSREVTVRKISPDNTIREYKAIIGKTAGGVETGILTTHHFKVYLALLELWEREGKPISESIHFTALRLMKRLEMKDSGEEYRRLKRWLRDLRQIPITFINSFYMPKVAEHTNLADLTVLSYLNIYERKEVGKQKRTRGYGEFRFDDHILENLVNNHTHPLRLDVINSFKKHRDLSILLYIYLDRNLAFKDKYEIGLEKLFDHLDLSQKQIRYPSDRKAKIEPVLEQLRGKELSTGVLPHAQVLRTKDGKNYKLVCRKKPFPKRLREQETPPQLQLTLPKETGSGSMGTEPDPAEPSPELFPLLIEKGLTQKQAAKLVAEKSPEVISDQLEYLPFRLKEYESQGKEINEAAIFYDSVNDNWKVPKSYLEAEKEREREARRLERERIALMEQEEWDRAEQERVELEAYKESLDPSERTKLREKALEHIRSMEGVKEDFITDILVKAKENEILKAQMEKREA